MQVVWLLLLLTGVHSGSVISNPPGMLSLPIGVAGNITQFMTAKGLKATQGTGIRPGTPLLLQQVC